MKLETLDHPAFQMYGISPEAIERYTMLRSQDQMVRNDTVYIDGIIVNDNDILAMFDESITTPRRFRQRVDQIQSDTVYVQVNSPGGDPMASSAMYTAMMADQRRFVAQITGEAFSAGQHLTLAADEIEISPSGFVMVHYPRARPDKPSTSQQLRALADDVDTLGQTVEDLLLDRTSLKRDELRGYMESETVHNATQAIQRGFADRLMEKGNPIIELASTGADTEMQKSVSPMFARIQGWIDDRKHNGQTGGIQHD